ncbi:MAG: hypothetical protein EZS28_014906 [Streblomastix strix]|uniref:Uncharacterized protein n=1 Tax=Streblomastix strix TaxID=222440 RepID=A0A5J4W4B6_9EUKA|nr:MAG: hypothetical protein EZS28_014906 [Streblomastix strix]
MSLVINQEFKKQITMEISKKGGKYKDWQGTEKDINGDKFPEFVVRGGRGFIQSADGFRITVPIKRQRRTKYFSEKPTKEDRATTHYKAWKEEDKPADGYRHFIKHYLSPFLKERGYTVAQVYSVFGSKIWKVIVAPWSIKRQLNEETDINRLCSALELSIRGNS